LALEGYAADQNLSPKQMEELMASIYRGTGTRDLAGLKEFFGRKEVNGVINGLLRSQN
jgi:hypothetical protein